jgi:hypothetical protein
VSGAGGGAGGAPGGRKWRSFYRQRERDALDSFVSRVVFFMLIFGACLLMAKLLYWLFDSAGLVRKRHSRASRTLSQV